MRKAWDMIGDISLPLLFIVVILLKIFGVIHWPWWVVLSPIWGIVAFVALIIIYSLIVGWWNDRKKKTV